MLEYMVDVAPDDGANGQVLEVWPQGGLGGLEA